MRDPKRIKPFCDKLAKLWEKVPDWRFGQLMSNLFNAFESNTRTDIFFPEDKELFEFFEKYFKEN